MRIKKSRSKNSVSYAVIKDITRNGKRTTKIVETLGNYEEIKQKHPEMDPEEWAKQRAAELTAQEKQKKQKIAIHYDPTKKIRKDKQQLFNVGYLFLQSILAQLKLPTMTNKIAKQHQFKYPLDQILSCLIYNRILSPASKKSAFEFAQTLLEPPHFQLQDIYRSLDVLAEHTHDIQEHFYRLSQKVANRETAVLYYDCTNFFFEIEEAEGLKQYGRSKENRPNPIVQMGLFMDGSGIPLAFNITSGNTNEQTTLKPLEKRILKDFHLSKFVVCTDAGLSSTANRKYNTLGERAFITTQSVKKTKKHLKEWLLDKSGWRLSHDKQSYNIDDIDETAHFSDIFYKERWIHEDGLEQRFIVSYSPKYRQYQAAVRQGQIDRALKKVQEPSRLHQKGANDVNRFIKSTHVTQDGEIAQQADHTIDQHRIEEEAQYDGFYAVCTNLTDPVQDILSINQKRWEIEASFRLMKNDFKSRPVYVRKDARIQAHFLTCFLSLTVFQLLEQKLDHAFTSHEIIQTLRQMDMLEVQDDAYVPAYKRTRLTDRLHDLFGFETDLEILSQKEMKKIIRQSKKAN